MEQHSQDLTLKGLVRFVTVLNVIAFLATLFYTIVSAINESGSYRPASMLMFSSIAIGNTVVFYCKGSKAPEFLGLSFFTYIALIISAVFDLAQVARGG